MFFHWQAKRRPGTGAYGWQLNEIGAPTFSSTTTKIGSHSLFLEHPDDANRDNLIYTTATPAPDFASLGVTMEFWLNIPATGYDGSEGYTNRVISTGLAVEDFNIEMTATSTSSFRLQGASSLSAGLNLNTWYHVAITQQSGTTNDKLYINGVGQADGDTGGYLIFPDDTIIIGNTGNNNDFDFYIDEVRLSIGLRYTANFTPPTTAFTADADTWFLAHFDNSYATD